MALPDQKTLDLAWLGSGVFCRLEPKTAVDTDTLDYAWLGSGPFVAITQGIAVLEILPTGVASGAAIGEPTLGLGVEPTAVASAAAVGEPTVTWEAAVAPTGVASAAAVGEPSLGLGVAATGVASAAAFGEPVLTWEAAVAPTGVASAAAFGEPTVTADAVIEPTGVTSGAAFGEPIVTSGLGIRPTGIASAAAFGSPGVGLGVEPGGVASGAAVGGPSVGLGVEPGGVTSGAAFGEPTLTWEAAVAPTGVTSGSAFGSPTIGIEVLPTGVENVPAFGEPTLGHGVSPAGVASAAAFGSPTVISDLIIYPTGVASGSAFGTPTMVLGVEPTKIASGASVGIPQVRHRTTIPPASTGWSVPLSASQPMELYTPTGTFVSLLPLASGVRVRQKINSLDVLTFDYPIEDDVWWCLDVGSLVRFQEQDYRIVSDAARRDFDDAVGSVQAEQYFINLGDRLVKELKLEDATPAAAVASAISGTGWSVGAVATSEPVSATFNWKSPLAILMQLADMTNGELYFDTQAKEVYLLHERGGNHGASLIYRKNIVGLDKQQLADKLFNRIYFEGKDGLTALGGGYIEDAVSIAMYGRRDYFWGDNTITKLSTLTYGAKLRLKAYKHPRSVFTCTSFNLQPSNLGSWVVAELGDTVKVYDEVLGIEGEYRVYEREWAPYDPTVPDRLMLSTDREWFPDLSEKLADEVLDDTKKAEVNQRSHDAGPNACKGDGGYNWLNMDGVNNAWKGDGLPHIWTSTWGADDPDDGLPLLQGGIWFAGHNTGGVIAGDGPWGYDVDGTWEGVTEWFPAGLDLDSDGEPDFWPFSGGGTNWGQPGGHDYAWNEAPSEWDYAGSDAPYFAGDYLGEVNFADLSAYTYYGYDTDGDGVAEWWDTIANLPVPLFRDSMQDGLVWGVDLGGGDVDWVVAGPTDNPLWHSYSRVGNLLLTGWDSEGNRNASGPIYDTATGIWSPPGIDTNDDGYVDFWPYGGAGCFGREWDSDGNPSSGVAVAACGMVKSASATVVPSTCIHVGTVTEVGDGVVNILKTGGGVLEDVPYLVGYSPTVGDTVVYGDVS